MLLNKKRGSTKDLVHGASPEGNIPAGERPSHAKKEKSERHQKGEGRSLGGVLRSKTLWGILCVAAGLLVAFVGVPAAQQKAAALTPVVVLTADAPVGTKLTNDMLSVVEMGASGVPKNAITSIADAAGKYMTATGLAEDILTAMRLSAEYPTDDPELLTLPEGKVAMAVALDSLEQSVASKLRSGDVIQLFAVLQDTPDNSDNTVAMVIPELRAVEVLSVTNNEAVNITDQDKTLEPDEDRQITTVVLAVNQQQAAALAGLTTNARLHSALVVRGNDTGKAAILAAQDEYFTLLEEQEHEEDDQTSAVSRVDDNDEGKEGEKDT